MKRILKSAFITCSVVFAMTALTSCGGEDPLAPSETDVLKGEASLPSTTKPLVIEIDAAPDELVKFKVTFAKADKSMYRLYVSQNDNSSNAGTVAYTINEDMTGGTVNIDTKRDGSIDLASADKEGFTKTLPLKASSAANSVVEYRIWATSGGALSAAKGDFRDIAKNNAYGSKDDYITVKIKSGTGGSAKGLKVFTAKIFAAPAKDGTSDSFMSSYNGQLFKISEAKESVALWDFGYYYGSTKKASFASVSAYPSDVVNVRSKSGITAETTLNKCFFRKENSIDFNAANLASIKGLEAGPFEKINNLAEGDVIIFEDAYGAKGLIKVDELKPGDNAGANGDYIKVSIKVQDTSVKL